LFLFHSVLKLKPISC